jgi:hypothetical protein
LPIGIAAVMPAPVLDVVFVAAVAALAPTDERAAVSPRVAGMGIPGIGAGEDAGVVVGTVEGRVVAPVSAPAVVLLVPFVLAVVPAGALPAGERVVALLHADSTVMPTTTGRASCLEPNIAASCAGKKLMRAVVDREPRARFVATDRPERRQPATDTS